MSNIFAANGQNIDNIFEPLGSFSKRANVNIFSGSTDISNRYAPVSEGSAASNTGIFSGSTDIGQLFAAAGSVVYWDGTLAPMPASVSDSGSDPQVTALAEIIFLANGQIRVRTNFPFSDSLVGNWTGSMANSSNTQVRFVVTSGTLTDNGATSFSQLNTTRSFRITATSGEGFKSASVRVELRQTNVSASTITKSVSLSVSHFGGGGLG